MSRGWTFGPDDGDLLVRTDVTGRASRLGHRLTIVMTQWRADVSLNRGRPVGLDVVVDADGLQVREGSGGVGPLSGPEKMVARGNALGSLDSRKHPQIELHADVVEPTSSGYRVEGSLTIHGAARPIELQVEVVDETFSFRCLLRQTDFGVRPYSLMMGSLKVADEVEVECTVRRPQ